MTGKSPIAVIWYSRSGHTRDVADAIAAGLDADMYELQMPRYASKVVGYARAGFDSLRRNRPRLAHPIPDLVARQAVILCAPVWTSYPAVPLRSYLSGKPALPQSVGLFLTSGDHSPPEQAYATAQTDLGRPFKRVAYIPNQLAGSEEAQHRIRDFCAAFGKPRIKAV